MTNVESVNPYWLPERPLVAAAAVAAVRDDYERFATAGLPLDWPRQILDRHGIDLSAEYAGLLTSNPFGKASGQLSMAASQVADDVAAGLGFVVLKTVIAQDERGGQSMEAWAIREARMAVEPITGRSGERGWTVTWKGRGWWQTFDEYLRLVREARGLADESGTVIVPSCKYHLPTPGESEWRTAEYDFTTRRLLDAWQSSGAIGDSSDDRPRLGPMPIEKDFSPTLAGSDRASEREKVLEWLRTVPRLMRSAVPWGSIRVGLKLFNAMFDDDFQIEMLRTIHEAGPDRPDFFVYGNRLFDPFREFDGHRGVAYGGPDLSDRNLRVMGRFHQEELKGSSSLRIPWSATGNILTGTTALEYALRGASSFQMHTLFQLPMTEYAMTVGNRTQRALHELLFHPETGFIVWMRHLAEVRGLDASPVRFRDVVGLGRLDAG